MSVSVINDDVVFYVVVGRKTTKIVKNITYVEQFDALKIIAYHEDGEATMVKSRVSWRGASLEEELRREAELDKLESVFADVENAGKGKLFNITETFDLLDDE